MFDQLGAIDRGCHEVRFGGVRTFALVDRATEFAIEDGRVEFAEFLRGRIVVHADDDAVGMEEVADGSAFAQKLRIGRDAKGEAGLAAIYVERALELLAGVRGHSAFLDDELGASTFGRDHAGDVVNGAEVGVAIFERRSADANEYNIAFSNGRTGSRL